MAIVDLTTLKGYFDNGDVPNQDSFYNLIDTLGESPGSILSEYLSLLGLRGFWPMSSINESGNIIDLSGQERHLTKSGASATLAISDTITKGIPYGLYSTDNYLYRADEAGLDILGTESYIHSSFRGLTCGCLVRVTTTPPSADVGIFGKYYATGNQRSYLLYRSNSSDKFRFGISNDGTAFPGIDSSLAYTIGKWNFLVGRFDPSTELAIFHNGVWSRNTTSIPSAIYASTARLELGSFSNGNSGTTWSHNGAFYFLTASYLSDSLIEKLYSKTIALFPGS